MYRIYAYLLLLTIHGFIPSGKINAIFFLFSWILISIHISSDIYFYKKKIKDLNIIPIMLLLSFIGSLIYIFPYSKVYNNEQIEDLLISVLNAFMFLIGGIIIRFKINSFIESISFDNESEIIVNLKKLLNLQKLNFLSSLFLLIFIPYGIKLVLFNPTFINVFNPQEGFLNYGYQTNAIDFTSINFLSLSIKQSTRNSFILIPFIYLFISFNLIMKIVENRKDISKIKNIFLLNELIFKNKFFYTSTYFISIIYLLCSSSRVGICLGYTIIIIFLSTSKFLLFDKDFNLDSKLIIKNLNANKKLKIFISTFFILITFLPYKLFFPYSCRDEIPYNTILINSSIPLVHEFKNINKYLRKSNEFIDHNSYCKNPIFPWKNRGAVFQEYSSSSFEERMEIYTRARKFKNIIKHESLIRDILYILNIVPLTLPLTIFILIGWISIISLFIIKISSSNIINKNKYTYKVLVNFIPIITSPYFLFNLL